MVCHLLKCEQMIFSDVQTQQCLHVFACCLLTKKEEKEGEVSRRDHDLLKEMKQRARTNSGIVNPGMEARNHVTCFYFNLPGLPGLFTCLKIVAARLMILPASVHWLPICLRIDSKIFLIT